MSKSLTYKSAGVDIAKADEFLRLIGPSVKGTFTGAVLNRSSAFGSLFDPSLKNYRRPVLVSSTDGVGTKLLIAKAVNKHDTVGIDLVAMNVNDVLCMGAKPLFFLDYIACGRVRPRLLKDVVKGIVSGCRRAGCSLIGGETAEMPDLYGKDDYDLAGFTVGVVEKDRIIDGARIEAGDRVVGLASSGLHSNGYSLVRKIFSPAEQRRMAAELLRPTRIYVREVLATIERFDVKGIAHITGGAFLEKLTKILPAGKCFSIQTGSWNIPNIFQKIQKKGKITHLEMFRTFNMGIGMALVVGRKDVDPVRRFLSVMNVKSFVIGTVIHHHNKIVFQS